MKNYFDGFYEIIHKNSVKRRRMISLLLVLSMFVSSGVLWELHDTVITMVNEDEPLCGIDEHTHTDECYEKVLICGLEENDEHTHTDECYEKVLKCSLEEHVHASLCYTDDEELPDDNVTAENNDSNIVAIDLPEEESEEQMLSEMGNEEFGPLSFDGQTLMSLDGEPDPANPVPLNTTIDNIAKGIKFTLFDYGNNDLEGGTNSYDIRYVDNEWVHNRYKDVGINSGRDPDKDIMFFAYGTPAFTGTPTIDDDDGKDYNEYRRIVGSDGHLNPSKNNYSGDYNVWDGYAISGNRPVQGIVNNKLANGYPTITGSNHSLEYLFSTVVSDDQKEYKSVYPNVNHLLQVDEKGHLYYNSDLNYAYYNQDTHDFTVYNTTFDIINDNHHYGTDINPKTGETYASAIPAEEFNAETNNGNKNPGFKIGFFPFDEYDYTKRDPNFDTKNDTYDHHFGMTMEAKFTNTKPNDNNKVADDPVVFKYSGDDDMWVFVDDKLVLDIGGIHEPTGGMIDFTNGLVWVQDNAYGKPLSEVKNEVKKIIGWSGDDDAYEAKWEKISKPIGINTESTSTDSVNRWVVKSLSSYYDNSDAKKCSAQDGETHTIKMFYLERGGCYSNLAMEINLPTVKPLTIMKSIDDQEPFEYSKNEYEFEVWKLENDGTYTLVNLGTSAVPKTSVRVKPGERVDIPDLPAENKYRVVEKGVDPNVISSVHIKATEATDKKAILEETFNGGYGDIGFSGNGFYDLNSFNIYEFKNTIHKESTNLKVTKNWSDGYANHPDAKVLFKLNQTDSKTGQTKRVAYDKKMTFVINKDTNWSYQFENLPKRYGDHVYTYSVEETNVPSSYKAVYGKDQNGDLTITNTSINDVDIYVKKNWKNTNDLNSKSVDVTLKRLVSNSVGNDSTTLRINLRDARSDKDYNQNPTNNIIKTITVDNVYVGGSVEFSLDLPEGVTYYNWDYKDGNGKNTYYKVTDGLELTQLDDKYFEVSNLQSGENVIDIKVNTDAAVDDLLLLHHTFTKVLNGWKPQGGTQVINSGTVTYAKNDAILVQNRDATSDGVKLYLDPAQFKVNKTYTFSVYVYYDKRYNYSTHQDDEPDNPDTSTFVMTFNDGLANNTSYHRVTQQSVTRGNWTQLTGTFTIPTDIDPYGMYLLIETEGGQDYPKSFRMDEFVAVEGYKKISVTQQSGTENYIDGGGIVTIQNNNDTLYNVTFDNLDNWHTDHFNRLNSSAEIQKGTANGNHMVVYNRSNHDYAGAQLKMNRLIPGVKFRIRGAVQGNGEGSAQKMHISFNSINKKPGGGDYSNLTNITNSKEPLIIVEGNEKYKWTDYDLTFDVPLHADKNNMYIYFETPNGENDYGSFRIRPFTITPVQPALTEEIIGYTLANQGVNGIYTSNYNAYDIDINADTATNPIHYTNFTEDTGWSRNTTLNSGNNWKANWTKTDLNEVEGKRYIYYIEETAVNDGNKVIAITNANDHKSGEANDYLVTYSGNDVAANDENNPILITNEYIWYKLPATGGSGTGRIYFLGGIFTAIGIISGSALYRRKRRRV